ncbi:MAG: FAD-dependent oxidoreductase [Rhodoferax sp.]|nr:FAD-dependent oxidoreductase [Rhodoferax sp.]
MAPVWGACDLAEIWANRADVTLLDTDFDQGQSFLHVWTAWRQATQRPRLLHYVGIAPAAPVGCMATSDMAQTLFAACFALEPGFHRITLEEGKEGRVLLTLCLGEKKTMLAEQRLQADGVWIAAPDDAFWDAWSVKLLAQRCRRGAWVCAPAWNPLFASAGFERDTGVGVCMRYNPRWAISTSRNKASPPMVQPGRCAVVGAGMAGASVAHALAQRGWQVQVFDQESSPAAAASGVPVGLAVPQLSTDDNPRSRITRCGIRLLLQQARSLLQQDQDWSPSGVLERGIDGQAVWHTQAAWIKPAELVRAWLNHPSIRFVAQARIERLTHVDALWQLHDAHNRALGDFELVVLANALGCIPLLRDVSSPAVHKLQAMHGTLSYGRHAEAIPNLPPTPVNGHGYFIPAVPVASGTQWLLGATFEPDALKAADIWAQHACNMQRLPQLWPPGGTELGETLERGPLELWSATRCVSLDRLPLLGPLLATAQSQLWLCTGLGSRGLSFAPLCAELLVANLMGEPLPLEKSLVAKLDANRA